MSHLRILQAWIATAVLSTGVAVVPGMAADNNQTFTGKVSDAMCGAKHTEAGIARQIAFVPALQKGANLCFGRRRQSLYP